MDARLALVAVYTKARPLIYATTLDASSLID